MMTHKGALDDFQPDRSNPDQIYIEIENRLLELAKGHRDIIGASVMIGKTRYERQTPSLFKATVIVYARPDNIVVDAKHEDLYTALIAALEAAERQIEKRRSHLFEKWDSSDKISVTPISHQPHHNRLDKSDGMRS